jgi:hypothetical protein
MVVRCHPPTLPRELRHGLNRAMPKLALWAIDSASGADNKYDSPVNIRLLPLQPGSSEVRELPASVPVTSRPRAAPATQ